MNIKERTRSLEEFLELGPGDTVVQETAKERRLPDTVEMMIRPFLWTHPQMYPGKMIRADILPAATLVRSAAARGGFLVAAQVKTRAEKARFKAKQEELASAFQWCFGHRRSTLLHHATAAERVRVFVVLLEAGAEPGKVKEAYDDRSRR